MIRVSALVAFLLLAGCDSLPRDPDGTLDRVREAHLLRAGIVAGLADPSGARHYIRRVAGRTGARAQVEGGSAEHLLARLDAGDLDLVVGEFGAGSPWGLHVSFLPALAERGTPYGNVLLVPAARNGENAWIALLHHEAKAMRGAAS
ncbi:hypothetical protein IC614_08095 [Allosphingosinicella flava]|uniref:ABC transporter substrate-binding protein n=2 Tax=Allosphingosinicella flava TaxID=2771430 RepID=A0A7T2GIT7_9SPHN|nr:hypothetical protein IC614_08095 [Sphingosinicella flava]